MRQEEWPNSSPTAQGRGGQPDEAGRLHEAGRIAKLQPHDKVVGVTETGIFMQSNLAHEAG